MLLLLAGCGSPLVGNVAPDFNAEDLDGNRITLSDYRGKVVLLDFWATWCGPCMHEMPNVRAAYEKYKGNGFRVIGISLDTQQEILEAVLERERMNWPQIPDLKRVENRIGDLYRVEYIPSTFLLDHRGIVRYANLRGNELEAAVVKLLEESAAETIRRQ